MTDLTAELQTLGFVFCAVVVGFTLLLAWGAAKFRGDVF